MIPFIKMHGTGNDFIIIDARARDVEFAPERIQQLGNRRTGIGFDQCIILKTSTRADVFMQIINADGSEVNACGNATRCVGWLVANEKGVMEVRIETKADVLQARLAGNHCVSVNMGKPQLGWQQIPLAKEMETLAVPVHSVHAPLPPACCVNMGNPHAVFFLDGDAHVDVAAVGAEIEHHPMFPERVNVSFARILQPAKTQEPRSNASSASAQALQRDTCESQEAFAEVNIKLEVWERGTGMTLACGTAACAALVAAVRLGLTGNKATIRLPGGDLEIFWDHEHTGDVFMTGAVAEVFRGCVS